MSQQWIASHDKPWPDLHFVWVAIFRSVSVFGISALGAAVAFIAGQSISLSQRSQFWLSLVFACVCLVGLHIVRSNARRRELSQRQAERHAVVQLTGVKLRQVPSAALVLLGISFPFFAAVSVASMRASPSIDLVTPTGMFGAAVVLAACVGLGLFAVRPQFRRLFFVLLPGALICYQVVVNDFRSQFNIAEARFQAIAVEQTLHAVEAYQKASEASDSGPKGSEAVTRAVAERLGAFYKGQRIGMGDISVRVGADQSSVVMFWQRRSVATPVLGAPKQYEIAKYLPAVATAIGSEQISYESLAGVRGTIQTRGVLTSAVAASSVAVGGLFLVQLTDDRKLDRPNAQLTSILAGSREARVVLVSGTAQQ